MRVDQVLCAAGPVDAVTNQALAYRSLFRRWGWDGHDYAPVQAHGMPHGAVRALDQIRSRPDVPLVLHYSGYARGLEPVLSSRRRTLLIFHNITPAHYFWATDPAEAVRCELARNQLRELAGMVSRLAGVSRFNARELSELTGRDAVVIPIVFDPSASEGSAGGGDGAGPATSEGPGRPPTVLFVGRLVPHKRQDLIIRAFARFRRRDAPDARLALVGTPLSPGYGSALVALAGEVAPGAVAFESALNAAQLAARYRSASVFLCLSEHEGFCIPLLEAFHFGVPVIARDAGAVGEVAGDAAVLVAGRDGVEVVAELLRMVSSDTELRARLVARGRRRLREYDHTETASRLREELGLLSAP